MAAALACVVLSWDVALVWVGVGKGGDRRHLCKSPCGPRRWPGAQPNAAAERGAQTGSWGWGQGSCIIPKAPLGPSGNPDALWGEP